MTAFSDAPPLGATNPTAGPTSTVWTGSENFDAMLQTLIDLNLEEQLRNPLPFLLPENFRRGVLTSTKGRTGTIRYLAIGDLATDVSDTSDIWVKIEGEPNDTEDLDFGYEEFSVKQAMKTIRLTDVATLTSPIELVAAAAEKLARWKLEVANGIAAKTMAKGTNIYVVGQGYNTGTASDVTPTDVLTGAVVKDIVSEMNTALIPTFPDGFYRAFIHPFVKLDFVSDAADGGWIDVQRYASPGNFLNGEIGTYAGVRFIKNIVGAKLADAGASSNDVYQSPFIGPGAFALGDFGATGGQNFFTPPGGHDDPGHQSALLTWIGYLGGTVIGEGDNATGPVSKPRYVTVLSASSKSVS
jgi:N4-gp56 family major capsid protein